MEDRTMAAAVITGASRGVGRAAAEIFAEKGYRLLINCQSRYDLLDEAAAALSVKTECMAVHGPFTADILARFLGSGSGEVRTAEVPETEQSGRAETETESLVLVNNAGISRIGLLQDVSDEEFEETVESNLGTMFRTTRAMIPYFLRNNGGHIINISSVWGVAGASCEVLYSLSKGGVNAFTRALAKELAPSHISVNALALGAVDTDMNHWLTKEDRQALDEEIPYGRMGSREEAAAMIGLLAEAPRYLTGQVIKFDGGWI